MAITASRAESTAYEVRCPRCNTSFAPETRRCIHCGGPVGRRAPTALREVPGEAADEDEIQLRLTPARSALWVATLLIAIVASLLRTCQ